MKRILIAFTLIIISLSGIYAMTDSKRSEDRSSIDKLWKSYEEVQRQDKPQKEAEILDQIKSLAVEKRLPWDFFKAGQLRVEAGSRRNWKDRETLLNSFAEEVRDFSSPVLSYCHAIRYRRAVTPLSELSASAVSELKSSKNSGFYEDDYSLRNIYYGELIIDGIENDYEYLLWSLYLRDGSEAGEAQAMLEGLLGESYPKRALLDFIPVARTYDEKKAAEACNLYLQKYNGKAAALFARQRLLELEMSELARNNAGSEAYLALRDRCREFEKDRKAFSGDEKKIAGQCLEAASMLEELESRTVDTDIRNDVLTVRVRNLDKVEVSLEKDGRKAFSTSLQNSRKSFYVTDTLSCTIPKIDDGIYTLKVNASSASCEKEYSRYSLAIAQKKDAGGFAVFVADAASGEPLSSVDMRLSADGKILAEVQGVKLDGFTYIPEAISSKIDRNRYDNALVCTYRDGSGVLMCTEEVRINWQRENSSQGQDSTYGSIFTDRSAFNPDEKVQFKAVLYHGNRKQSLAPVEEGKKVTVSLLDPSGKKLSELDLKTSEFGSVAGEFNLPRGEKNGFYTLQLFCGTMFLSSANIRVDDFQLPSFELNWEPETLLHFSGETMKVSGNIQSYSGHSLSGAKAMYSITQYGSGEVIKEGQLAVEADGKFSIEFKSGIRTSGSQEFRINVRVTDNTGETLEWNTSRRAYSYIPFNVRIKNTSEGSLSMPDRHEYNSNEQYSYCMVSDELLRISFGVNDSFGGTPVGRSSLDISYELLQNGKRITRGSARPGQEIELPLDNCPSGMLRLVAAASDIDTEGKKLESRYIYDVLLCRDNDDSINADIENMFKVIDSDECVGLQIGSTAGPSWVSVELYGTGNVLLGRRLVHLNGKRGEAGSVGTVTFPVQKNWSDIVTVSAIYFRNYREYRFGHQFDRSERRLSLPLEFTRFEDKTLPHTGYSFEIQTRAGVECAATVFDKSTETVMGNTWQRVNLFSPDAPSVYYSTFSGNNSTREIYFYAMDDSSSKGGRRVMLSKARASNDMMVESVAMAVEEDSIPAMAAAESQAEGAEPAIRENFANTIAFEPFLRSDANGRIEFAFTTADKLSTYYVQLFAHDKELNNAVLRREMQVSIPVKVSAVEPQFLYTGDRYVLQAAVSSSMEAPIEGTLSIDWYDNADYRNSTAIKHESRMVRLEAMQSISEDFSIEIPGISTLGVKLSFTASDRKYGSDALFFTIPVYSAFQTITEAHSSILRSGEDEAALTASLRAMFVNSDGSHASVRKQSLKEMILEAIPTKAEPASDNVLDLSEALFVRMMASSLGAKVTSEVSDEALENKIMECRNSDGGFAWFKGWESSPVITAEILGRIAAIRRNGLDSAATVQTLCGPTTIENAVRYLDKQFFNEKARPLWCGGISEEQYISLRVEFAEVDFNVGLKDLHNLREFRKWLKTYLLPKDSRGLEGAVLQKARRARVMYGLTQNEEGIRLAKAWGIKLMTSKRLSKSFKADMESLIDYAVAHKSGGMYYPNAVMPFRGLLESEAYAHAFICGLLSDSAGLVEVDGTRAPAVADGIRLWLMVQKESQNWYADAAFVEAMAAVLDASEEILDTRVISLSETVTRPFSEIRASGNGFTVSRDFKKEVTENGKKIWKDIAEGDTLNVGDRIRADYHIWNEENRSFVKISAPDMASMRPVNQLSGSIGWWLRPLTISGWHSFSPSGYRNVTIGRSEYWFDCLPEEKTELSEEFFITQKGSFQMPAMEVESLYAPHYRANEEGRAAAESR